VFLNAICVVLQLDRAAIVGDSRGVA